MNNPLCYDSPPLPSWRFGMTACRITPAHASYQVAAINMNPPVRCRSCTTKSQSEAAVIYDEVEPSHTKPHSEDLAARPAAEKPTPLLFSTESASQLPIPPVQSKAAKISEDALPETPPEIPASLKMAVEKIIQAKLLENQVEISRLLRRAQNDFEQKYALHPICYARDTDLKARLAYFEKMIKQTGEAAQQAREMVDELSRRLNNNSTVEELFPRIIDMEERLHYLHLYIQEQQLLEQQSKERLYIKF